MLAGDADRDRAVEVLSRAFTEGRLRPEEYDERLGLAYQARTYADLDRLTQDIPLPRPYPAALPAYPAPFAPRRNDSYATASLVCGVVGTMTFGLSSIPAIVLGHMAKRRIRRTGDDGAGLATAGLILGYLVTLGVLVVLGLIVALVAVAPS
ncbi:DUF1707 and DUF4190 domain-containing protein [Actinacidiphila yeochonensis]|uniref:DUF1707 and DUF4190 domain-containing protein n=1 Tax=Actinacidiphila yeochonensis TaxID=89050 RepID=UPI000560113C|nr:DUF1707 and DUF4190 domain-containing protein [Actinacidiphila yeochonensis]